MANAPVVVTDAGDETPAVGELFKDVSFFLTARVPTRSKFVADIEANGGRVVKLEKYADFVIADHMRKPLPADGFSYTLIEQAIRDGSLPDPADHALRSATDSPRAAGSRVPGKRTRTAFTAEDDRVLWQWVERERAQGESVKGNDIYKRLELVNTRHTWQAWRDHYVKKLIDHPPAVEIDHVDFDLLWEQARDIENMDEAMYEEAWDLWAGVNERHTADEWRHIWESHVRPAYRKRHAKTKTKRRRASMSGDDGGGSTSITPRKRGKTRASAAKVDDVRDHGTDQQPNGQDYPAAEAMTSETNRGRSGFDGALGEPDDDLAALETWQDSSKRSSGRNYRLAGPDAPTTEVDRAVGEQIQAEINLTTNTEPLHLSEQIITSDANHAADLQIRNEADVAQPEQHASIETELRLQSTNEMSGNTFKKSHDGNDGHEATRQNDLHTWYAERLEELKDLPKTNGHALTEANLISQQAEHAEPLTRGVDLPKDDHNKDQSEYVKFLQNITGHAHAREAHVEGDSAHPVAQDAQAAPIIPMSSQQEVGNIMEDALDWPSPSQRNASQSQGQEEQFETQNLRTNLPLSKQHVRGIMPDFEISSQSMMSQDNDENLPGQGEHGATNPSFPVARQHSTGVKGNLEDESYRKAQPDTFEGFEDMADDHIDLSIPEPEGDFTFTPSPDRNRSIANEVVNVGKESAELRGSTIHDLPGSSRFDQKPGPLRNEVVYLSSDASSSSLPSSHAEVTVIRRETGKNAVETQDILNAETQLPDFFMPLPDDAQDQDEEVDLAQQASPRNLSHTRGAEAVVMQAPGLSIATPPDWEKENGVGYHTNSKEPERRPKQKQKAVESQTMDVERELESWLAIQHVRGFSEVSAIAAMQRSSMRPDLAELILLAEKGGLGLPNDIPGIWSEMEDDVLESGDSGALRRLEAKHGWDECDARMRFLAEWREA